MWEIDNAYPRRLHHCHTHATTKHTRRDKKSCGGPFGSISGLVVGSATGSCSAKAAARRVGEAGGRRRVRGAVPPKKHPVSEEHRAAAAQRRLRASTNRVLLPEARTGRAPAPRAPRPCEQQPMGLHRCANGPQPPRPSLAAEEASAKRPYGARTFMARSSRPARPPALVARRTSGSRAANRRRAPNPPGWLKSRALCGPAERYRRTARYGRGVGLPSGRMGRHSPGQPVAAWSSSGARCTQQANRATARRALWTRSCDGQ